MRSKTLIEEEKIERTVSSIRCGSFTVLEFMNVFKRIYFEDWKMLVEKFGLFGEKRRYTVTTYLSNRLDLYSQKHSSLLVPFKRYSQARFENYRKTTKVERKTFGGPWIAVFVKKSYKPEPTQRESL